MLSTTLVLINLFQVLGSKLSIRVQCIYNCIGRRPYVFLELQFIKALLKHPHIVASDLFHLVVRAMIEIQRKKNLSYKQKACSFNFDIQISKCNVD